MSLVLPRTQPKHTRPMNATQQQYEEAVKLYEEGSSGDVYAYAEKLGIDEWSECVLCDAITPDCHDGACFVCGSPKITFLPKPNRFNS